MSAMGVCWPKPRNVSFVPSDINWQGGTIFHICHLYFSLVFTKFKKQPQCEICKNMYCHNCMAVNMYWRYTTQYNTPAKPPPCKLESHGTQEQHSEGYILEDKVLACHLANGYQEWHWTDHMWQQYIGMAPDCKQPILYNVYSVCGKCQHHMLVHALSE